MTAPTKENSFVLTGLWGSFSSAVGHTLAYPFDFLKTRQQATGEKAQQIVRAVMRQQGFLGFYSGYPVQIVRNIANGLWVWPTMKYILSAFKQHTDLPPVAQHIATGTAVGAVATLVTNPFERAKMSAMVPDAPPITLRTILQTGWKGVGTNWANTAVNYSAFLVFQKFFQKKHREENNRAPTHLECLTIGSKVACAVTATAAITDLANTHKMSFGASIRTILASHSPAVLFRGIVPSVLSRVARNSTSAWAVDRLDI